MCLNGLPTGQPGKEDVTFEFESREYKTDRYAYATELIVLSDDGRLLLVLGWSEKNPPSPIDFKEMAHSMNRKDPNSIAAHYGAAIATPC